MPSSDVVWRPSLPQYEIIKRAGGYKHLTVVCGRRFGKTEVGAVITVQKAQERGSLVVVGAPTHGQVSRIWMPRLKQLIPADRIKRIRYTSPQSIELTNGSTILLFGLKNYDALRGLGISHFTGDEMQDVKKEAWEEVILPALSDRDGSSFVTGTPKGINNLLYDLYHRKENNHANARYTTVDGGRVSEAVLQGLKQTIDPRTYRQEFEAEFQAASSLAYYAFTKDHVIDGVVYEAGRKTVLTFDFNATVKPFAAIVLQQMPGGEWVAVDEVVFSHTNTEQACQILTERLHPTPANVTITGDYAGNASRSSASRSDYEIIRRYFKNWAGYYEKVTPVRSIKDRIAATNALFKNAEGGVRLLISKKCAKLIADLERVEWAENGTTLNDKDPERTHPTDALSYMAYNLYPVHIATQKVSTT